MIDHKHKCIFVHIPRTAGSSIEKMICGKDWWNEDRGKTKHITANTAKKIYSEYWDEYFKFSFVRNPWSRMVSLSKWPDFYGCKVKDGKINVDEYIKKYYPQEIDPRSRSAKNKDPEPIENSIYLNILNEEIDYIGRFENLKNDITYVCEKIQLKNKPLPHSQKSKLKTSNYQKFYDEESASKVKNIYEKDIERFGYSF